MPVPLQEGLFTVDPPRLLGARCGNCGHHHFPRLEQCPYCGSDDVANVELSATGTLWGWTAVTAAPPGYVGTVPYGFGIVELPEGLRVITRLTSPVDGYSFGQPMQLRVVELGESSEGETLLTWEFGPEAERGS
jgi:uncharacterized OB-fold protein